MGLSSRLCMSLGKSLPSLDLSVLYTERDADSDELQGCEMLMTNTSQCQISLSPCSQELGVRELCI